MPRTILAFDYGLRRIGIAVGQDVTGSASPLGVVDNREDGPDFDRITKLVQEWKPQQLVVGLPLHADGSEGGMSDAAQEFAGLLSRYDLPVDMMDERFSSAEAENLLKQARAQGSRGRIQKSDIDAAAAVMIAERYLLTTQS